MKFAIMALAALCAATAALGKTTEISVPGGSAVYLPGSEIMVLFSDVQDVRCPFAVRCVWEGLIRVDLELAVPGDQPETVVLCNACDYATRTARYGSHTITLLRLEPGREVLDPLSRPVQLSDYTVVLQVDWQ